MKKRLFIYIFASLLIASAISAQESDVDTVSSLQGIEIQTSVDKAEIYIGDLVTYKLTIVYDTAMELLPPPLGANLGAFDVKDYQPDQVTKLEDGRIQSENIFVLSTFTTGDYFVPPIPVVFKMPDGKYKALLSEAVPIKVLSMLFNVDDSTDIKPLKAQYEFERDLIPYYLWGGLALLIIIIGGLFIWSKLKKRDDDSEPVDLRPAWEISFEKLAFLKQNNYLLENNFKPFYYELTEIVRSFHEKVYKTNFMDMTTEEFLVRFKELDLPENLYEDTKLFLNHADLVKFAKYIPAHERAESDFKLAQHMIENVRLFILNKQNTETVITSQQAAPVTESDDEPKEPVQ